MTSANAWINEYPEKVQTVVRLYARSRLREWLPRAKEPRDLPARMFGYAYGPGYRGVICTLILSKRESSLESRGEHRFPIRIRCCVAPAKSTGTCRLSPSRTFSNLELGNWSPPRARPATNVWVRRNSIFIALCLWSCQRLLFLFILANAAALGRTYSRDHVTRRCARKQRELRLPP